MSLASSSKWNVDASFVPKKAEKSTSTERKPEKKSDEFFFMASAIKPAAQQKKVDSKSDIHGRCKAGGLCTVPGCPFEHPPSLCVGMNYDPVTGDDGTIF